ncbi:MAG: family efflux transporter permease subunit [Pseudonocardiales bacterium]|nr:family efflux transporter permease subunit [Pseudonocardiales bacterium]
MSIVFVTAMFMSIMDVTIVNVALPQLGRDLHVGATGVAAVAVGYLVSLAVVIPASGWLGDRFGGKRILLTAIVVFTLASALCGFAQTLGELVAFRVLQGIGGGMLTPVGMAMLFRVFPPAERVRASSILVVPTALAPAIGPVLGGILVDGLSWRWVFFVNLPIGVFALVFGLMFLDEVEMSAPGRFDILGFALSGVGFASLMYGVSEGPQKGWDDVLILATIVIGVVLIGLLIFTQLRTAEPLLNLRLFRDRLFRSATVGLFVATAAFLGLLYLVALFFQDGLGLSAFQSGLSTFPEALGVMAGAQVASRILYPRFGPRRLMVGGLTVVAAVMAAMALIDSRDQLWAMRGLMFALGFAMAHNFVPTQAAAFARISAADTGRASTTFNALRQLGGAVGVAVLTSVITAVGVTHIVDGATTPDLTAYHAAFLVAAGLALVGALIALTIHDQDADSTRPGHVTRPVTDAKSSVSS